MPRERTILHNPAFWVLLVAIGVVGVLRAWRSDPGNAARGVAAAGGAQAAPAGSLPAPAFSLLDQNGEPFDNRSLEGSTYVGNFFFTSCPSICPVLMDAMEAVQKTCHREGLEVRFVSFTVDPKRDTPDRLREYATSRNLDLHDWTLLTGPLETMREVVVNGFQVPMGEPEKVGDLIDIAHSGKFVLVDAAGRVEGYFAYGPEGRKALLEQVRRAQGQPTL